MARTKLFEGWNWRIVFFLALALGIRIFYSYDVWVGIQGDAVVYINIANDFFNNGIMGPGDSRPPFYPLVVALAAKLFQTQPNSLWLYTGLNIVCDLLSMFFLLRIGRRVAEGSAIFGILLVALSPLWFSHVNAPVTEPITVTLFLLFLERWTLEKRTRRDEIICGLSLGCMTLTRGMFLLYPLALVLLEWILPKMQKGFKLEGKRRLVFLLAAYILPVLWGARNQTVMNRFTMTQSDDTAIIMAWNAIKLPTLDWHIEEHRQFESSHPWSDVLLGRADPKRTQEVYGLMREELIDFIKTHPFQYIQLQFPKMARLWVTGWWNPFSYAYSPPYMRSIFIGGFCLPVLFFGLTGLILQWRNSKAQASSESTISKWRAVRAQVLLVLYITGITSPFTVDARYSLPAYVTFCLWMGLGVQFFLPKTSKKST